MSETPTPLLVKHLRNLRRSSLFRELVPMEAALSLPIPLFVKGKLYFQVFAYTYTRHERGLTEIYPPFTSFILDLKNGKVVRYDALSYIPTDDTKPPTPIGKFPHSAIAKLKVSEYEQKRLRFFEIIAEIGKGNLKKEDAEELKDVLSLLLEPCFVPYFKKAAPKFMAKFYSQKESQR